MGLYAPVPHTYRCVRFQGWMSLTKFPHSPCGQIGSCVDAQMHARFYSLSEVTLSPSVDPNTLTLPSLPDSIHSSMRCGEAAQWICQR